VVTDFTLQYKYGTNNYAVVAAGIKSQSYTVVGLASGVSYTFKVLATNAYGSSSYSVEKTILSA